MFREELWILRVRLPGGPTGAGAGAIKTIIKIKSNIFFLKNLNYWFQVLVPHNLRVQAPLLPQVQVPHTLEGPLL